MPSADLLASIAKRSTLARNVVVALLALTIAAVALAVVLAPDAVSRALRTLGLPVAAADVVASSAASMPSSGVPADALASPASPAGAAAAGSRKAGRDGAPAARGPDAPDDEAPMDDEAGNPTPEPPTTKPAEPATSAELAKPAEPPRAALRPRPLTECLADIAAEAGRGLVVAPDVSGEAVAVFDASMPWSGRLAAVARIHGFQYAVSDHLIEVWNKRKEDEERAAARQAAKDQQAAEPLAINIVERPVHARADDLVTAVSKAARAAKVQVSSDPGSNAVVIAGAEDAAGAIADLVHTLDVPRRRFVLEAEIVELSTKARQELGVRWSIDGTIGAIVSFPPTDPEGDMGSVVVATDGAHALRARISALASDGHVRVISRPRVVVLEGRPASIESVRILRVRYPEQTAIVGEAKNADGVSGNQAVQEIPAGVVLKVEPSMRGDGKIVLRIRAKSSTLGPPQPPDNIPEEFSRMVDAEVAVADGETAVLGGLMREGDDRNSAGVPLLRSVPLVGALFGKRGHADEQEELVVLVTPRLLPP